MYTATIGGSTNDFVRDQERRPVNMPEMEQKKGIGDLQIIFNSLNGFNLAASDMIYSLESKMCNISMAARNRYQCEKDKVSAMQPEPDTIIEMIRLECSYLESHIYRLNQLNDIINILI